MKLPAQSTDTIETWRLGFIATVAPDGTPNVSPKGTFVVLDEETIAFGEMRSPNTIANIAHQAEVEVNFVDVLSRKGTRIRGKAEIVEKGSAGFEALLPQFTPLWGDLCELFNVIVKIPVDQVKPLQSPAYETGATEAELRNTWQTKIAEMKQ